MVLPSVIPNSRKETDKVCQGSVPTKQRSGFCPSPSELAFRNKRGTRLSRKRRKAWRRRVRYNKEVKKMACVDKGPYDFYWHNYFRCIKWVQSHHASYWKSRVKALEYENSMLRSLLEQSSPNPPSFSGTLLHNQNCKNGKNYVNKESDNWEYPSDGRRNGAESEMDDCNVDCEEKLNTSGAFGSSNDEFEFEVDDNMIEFFTQSMKHKLALQRERGEEEGSKVTDSNNKRKLNKKNSSIGSMESIDYESDYDACAMGLKKVLPTHYVEQTEMFEGSDLQDILFKKHEREEREKQKHELFGKSASKILGMETAVQLNFTQICASKQPTVWPIIPLNL